MSFIKKFGVASLPLISILAGGLIGAIVDLPAAFDASLLAVASGLILSAIITEIAPKISEPPTTQGKTAVLFGIVGGALLMIGLRYYSDKKDGTGSSNMLVWLTSIDFFIDGLVNGMTAAKSPIASISLSVALSIEAFTVTSALVRVLESEGKTKMQIFTQVGILFAAMLGGAVVGYNALNYIGKNTKAALFAIALPVFLWIVFKEFLPDAYGYGSSLSNNWIDFIWMSAIGLGIFIDWTADAFK